MSEATEIASLGITTMLELMQAKEEIKRLQTIIDNFPKLEPILWQWRHKDKDWMLHQSFPFEIHPPKDCELRILYSCNN